MLATLWLITSTKRTRMITKQDLIEMLAAMSKMETMMKNMYLDLDKDIKDEYLKKQLDHLIREEADHEQIVGKMIEITNNIKE